MTMKNLDVEDEMKKEDCFIESSITKSIKSEIFKRILDLCNIELILENKDEKIYKTVDHSPGYEEISTPIIKKLVYLRDKDNKKQKLWLSTQNESLEALKNDLYEFDYEEEIDMNVIYEILLEYIREYKLYNVCEEDKKGVNKIRFIIPSFSNLTELQIKLDLISPSKN